jgi:uncharacterized protein
MRRVPPLTARDEELLRGFLASPKRREGTLGYTELRGCLFALCGAPAMVPPSEWIPVVFAGEEPEYEDLAEARKVMLALMSLYNHTQRQISGSRETTPTMVGLDVDSDDELRGWSRGFSFGFALVQDHWWRQLEELDDLDEERFEALVLPLLIWSDPDEFFEERHTPEAREKLLSACRAGIDTSIISYGSLGLALFRMRQPGRSRPIREAQRVGRNEPCPCGSGRKYKKCCLN